MNITLGEVDRPCLYISVPANYCVRINGVDYDTVTELRDEGITVRAWNEETGNGTGPHIFIPMEQIDSIHIY